VRAVPGWRRRGLAALAAQSPPQRRQARRCGRQALVRRRPLAVAPRQM